MSGSKLQNIKTLHPNRVHATTQRLTVYNPIKLYKDLYRASWSGRDNVSGILHIPSSAFHVDIHRSFTEVGLGAFPNQSTKDHWMLSKSRSHC